MRIAGREERAGRIAAADSLSVVVGKEPGADINQAEGVDPNTNVGMTVKPEL